MRPRHCYDSPTLSRRCCISWQRSEMSTFTFSILVVRDVWHAAIACRISALSGVVEGKEGELPSLTLVLWAESIEFGDRVSFVRWQNLSRLKAAWLFFPMPMAAYKGCRHCTVII